MIDCCRVTDRLRRSHSKVETAENVPVVHRNMQGFNPD